MDLRPWFLRHARPKYTCLLSMMYNLWRNSQKKGAHSSCFFLFWCVFPCFLFCFGFHMIPVCSEIRGLIAHFWREEFIRRQGCLSKKRSNQSGTSSHLPLSYVKTYQTWWVSLKMLWVHQKQQHQKQQEYPRRETNISFLLCFFLMFPQKKRYVSWRCKTLLLGWAVFFMVLWRCSSSQQQRREAPGADEFCATLGCMFIKNMEKPFCE